MMIPSQIDAFMYDVLAGVSQRLMPDADPTTYPVKRHVWYDRLYLGQDHEGKPIRWVGWYANFRGIDLGCIYIDYVKNDLPYEEQVRLYGEVFSDAVRGFQSYICLFITGCRPTVRNHFERQGFLIRQYSQSIHPSIVCDVSTGVSTDETRDKWAIRGETLLCLQREMCIIKRL